MIKRTTLAVVAALVAGGASSSALAASMDNDANTGLWSYIYYGPIADLQKQGLPISSQAAAYVKQHGTPARAKAAAQPTPGNVYLLEDRQGITGGNGLVPDRNVDDKQSGHMW